MYHTLSSNLRYNHFIQFLLRLTERNPDIYLDEMQDQLRSQHGVIVGLSTIWDTLTELGLSRKRVCILFICQRLYYNEIFSSRKLPRNVMNVHVHDFVLKLGQRHLNGSFSLMKVG